MTVLLLLVVLMVLLGAAAVLGKVPDSRDRDYGLGAVLLRRRPGA